MQENIKAKYGITSEELKKGIHDILESLFKLSNESVIWAIYELLHYGDVKAEE